MPATEEEEHTNSLELNFRQELAKMVFFPSHLNSWDLIKFHLNGYNRK